MLSPVPGLTHLKVLTPPPPLIDAPASPTPPSDSGVHRRAEALVRIALESAFGMRPLHQLRATQFAPPVRLHIAARRRLGVRGVVRIDTFHLRSAGPENEVFGTAVAAGKAHAFTGRVVEQRLASFRVL